VLQRVQRSDFPSPRQVSRSVPAPLEAVCLKAMALAPDDRYLSPKDLADDIEHWLADEPVAAYPEPWRKRAARWGRRHRTLVASAGVLGGSLLVASVVAAGLLARANAETRKEWLRAEDNLVKAQAAAARAEATVKFLTDDLLAEAAPEKNPRQKQVTVEEVLKRAAQKIDTAFAGKPEIEATVRTAVGLTYRLLGQYAEAEPHLRRAVQLREDLYGPEHPDSLSVVNNLALLLYERGKLDEAEPLLRQNLEAQRRILGPDQPGTLTALNNLALLLQARGKFDAAEPLYRESLEVHRRVLGPEHASTLTVVHNLANLYRERGKFDEAEQLHRQNLESRRRILGPDHPETLGSVNSLANLQRERGKFDEAEQLLRQNLESTRRILGPEHPQALRAISNLGSLLAARGKLDEAEPLLLVQALGAMGGFPHLLHGRQKQGDENADDGDHNQQLDEREATPNARVPDHDEILMPTETRPPPRLFCR
jgi:tetratricopeptide (TPR) repeat protein